MTKALTIRLIIQFIAGLITGSWEGFEQERARIASLIASGAKQQRDAQKQADDEATDRAGAIKDELDKASDDDLDAEFDKWVRRP